MCRKWWILICSLMLVATLLLPVKLWSYLFQSASYLYNAFHLKHIFESSTLYFLLQRPVGKSLLSFNPEQNPLHSDSDSFYQSVINEVVRLHEPRSVHPRQSSHSVGARLPVRSLELEALQSLKKAKLLQSTGHYSKARKLLEHAFRVYPDNSDVLVTLGEVIEASWLENSLKDKSSPTLQQVLSSHSLSKSRDPIMQDPDELLITAEHLYTRALIVDPYSKKAEEYKSRLMPLIEEIDQRRLNNIDAKVRRFYGIPENNAGLRRTKLEHYFKHIYHSNAIEGNTLTLAQTRSILETRLAVGGKSLMEQNEVLGLDSALRFINATLTQGKGVPITLATILELHKRILGFVDPSEAGRLRRTQVFIADHRPAPAEAVPNLMSQLVDWFNSDDLADVHPIELAALMHWKLVHIHPFYDGNGRTARLLMNLILMRSGFPPAIIKIDDRPAYYMHLKTANDGDVRPFIRFIAGCTERTVDEYLEAASEVSRTEQPTVILPEFDFTTETPSNKCSSRPLFPGANFAQTSLMQLSTSRTCYAEPKHQLQKIVPTSLVRFFPSAIHLGG